MTDPRRLAAARRVRHANRKPPAQPPSPLHRCFCHDPWLPHDHQLGDHAEFQDGAR